jgi:hypothetical protein
VLSFLVETPRPAKSGSASGEYQFVELCDKAAEKPETRGARPLAVMQSLLRLRRAPLADVTALIVFAGFVVVFVKYGIPILAEP